MVESAIAMATGSSDEATGVTDGKGALPCHHQELVDLRVFELVVRVPHFGLQLLLDTSVCFT